MTGWTVEDEAGKTYTFPSGYTLTSGGEVRLHTGSGTDSSTDLYWNRGSAVWNNSGDTVSLYEDDDTLHTQDSY
jgi:competence protein ComEC